MIKKKKRSYDMLGRRILAILAEGGARKHAILRAIAGSEERLQAALDRLKHAGLIQTLRRRGGIHYDLIHS
jgi:DNA-binding transcriptional regulator PaaX